MRSSNATADIARRCRPKGCIIRSGCGLGDGGCSEDAIAEEPGCEDAADADVVVADSVASAEMVHGANGGEVSSRQGSLSEVVMQEVDGFEAGKTGMDEL